MKPENQSQSNIEIKIEMYTILFKFDYNPDINLKSSLTMNCVPFVRGNQLFLSYYVFWKPRHLNWYFLNPTRSPKCLILSRCYRVFRYFWVLDPRPLWLVETIFSLGWKEKDIDEKHNFSKTCFFKLAIGKYRTQSNCSYCTSTFT